MILESEKDRIDSILDAISKADAGDYSTALDFASPDDQLGLLADAVNRLLAKTDKRIASMSRFLSDLKEDAGRYRNIIDSIEESYFEADLKGNLQFFNERVMRELGYTEEELRGMHFSKLFAPSCAQKIYDAFHHVFLTGQPTHIFEFEILRKNKEKIDVESSISLLRDEAGNPNGFRGVVRDVSQRKADQETLRKSEEKYRNILESMKEIYLEIDLAGNYLFFNDSLCLALGYSREELQNASYKMITPPGSQKIIFKMFNDIYRTGQTKIFVDHEVVAKNGSFITLEMTISLMRTPQGEPMGFSAVARDVTKRLKTEKKLKDNELRLRLITDNIRDIIWTVDFNLNFTYISPSIKDVLGFSSEEIMPIPVKAFIPQPRYQALEKLLSDELAKEREGRQDRKGKAVIFEMEMLRKGGKAVWVEISADFNRDESGKPFEILGVTRDISERKRAEKALRESGELYRKSLETTSDGVSIVQEGKYVYINQRFLETLGIEQDVPNGQNFGSFTHPEDIERIKHYYEKRLKGEPTPGKHEMRIVTPDQSVIHLSTTSIDIIYNDRPALLTFIQDISEKKRAEGALKESERRYRMIVENIREIIWTTNFDLQYTYISPSCLWLTGYTPEEIVTIPLDQLLTPDSFALAIATMTEELSLEFDGEAVDKYHSRTLEQEIHHKDGGTVWLEVTAIFTRDDTGKASGMLMAGRDITARKKAEEEKNRLEAQLIQAQRMEMVGRLAGGVAHDFNNMLSVILGYADLAKLRLARQHPVLKDIAEIEKAAIRSRDITAQLLAFSRKQIIEPKIIDLNDMVAHSQKALIRLIGEDIEMKFLLGEKLWAIKFDPSQIEQILINLAVNARDAMPNGGRLTLETANVVLSQAYCNTQVGLTPGPYVRLSVSDNGMGMSREILQNIFEPFFTTKEPGKGTGLGLATVYGIIKQNNGYIAADSEPKQGTTFTIYLPRTEEIKEVEAEIGHEPEFTGTGNILLVEDDAMVLQITQGMLESLGYRVTVAEKPLDAIALCANPQTAIDLVITDVIMPVMSGKDLRDKMLEIRPGLTVLFMSGYTADVIAHHGVLEPGVLFLQKPFSIKSLALKVSEAMAAK